MIPNDMMVFLRYYLSPFFLSKSYITRDIRFVAEKYKFSGTLLDFGCGSKPYKRYFNGVSKYDGIDFSSYSVNKGHESEAPDFFFSEEYSKNYILKFDDSSFDIAVGFQVLEHHPSPEVMISELARVTKKGGYILITAPFLGGLHEEPHDYQRFTKYGLTLLLQKNGYHVLELLEQGSLSSTLVMLFNEYINDLVLKGGYMRFIGLLMYPFSLILQYLCLVLDHIFVTNKICFNYLILAKK